MLLVAICLLLATGAMAETAKNDITIGYICANLTNQGWLIMNNTIQEASKEAGVTLKYMTAEMGDTSSWLSCFEDLRNMQVDAILFGAADATLISAIEDAVAEGILCVEMDSPSGAKGTNVICIDNYSAAAQGAQWVGEALGGKGSVILINGDATYTSGTERRNGYFRDAGQELPRDQGVRIGATAGPTKRDERRQDALTALNDDVDAVICCWDGATSWSTPCGDPGLTDSVKLIGFDGAGDALSLMRQGKIAMDVAQPFADLARNAVDVAVKVVGARASTASCWTPSSSPPRTASSTSWRAAWPPTSSKLPIGTAAADHRAKDRSVAALIPFDHANRAKGRLQMAERSVRRTKPAQDELSPQVLRGHQGADDVGFDSERARSTCSWRKRRGKSTLIKIITGAYSSTGSMWLDGREYRPKNAIEAQRMGISAVYQEFNLMPKMKVYENIFISNKIVKRNLLRTLDRKEMILRSEALLAELGAGSALPRRWGAWASRSGRCRNREGAVARRAPHHLRRAVGGFDGGEIRQLMAVISPAQGAGHRHVYISHRLEEIFEIGDRVTILRDANVTCWTRTPPRDHGRLHLEDGRAHAEGEVPQGAF